MIICIIILFVYSLFYLILFNVLFALYYASVKRYNLTEFSIFFFFKMSMYLFYNNI